MSSTHAYDRAGFLSEFFPDAADRAEVEAGAQALVNVSRAHRLAEIRKRLGLTQAEVAERSTGRNRDMSMVPRTGSASVVETMTATGGAGTPAPRITAKVPRLGL